MEVVDTKYGKTHCPLCSSKNISFIDTLNVGHGLGKLYQCGACFQQFVLDSNGLLVRDA